MKKKHLFFLFILFIFFVYNSFALNKEFTLKRIFVLHSYTLGNNWTHNIQEAIYEYFKKDKSVFLQIEFMDTKRSLNGPEDIFENFYKYFKIKYDKTKFDCIICSDNDAYSFLLKYGDELFGSSTPIVFCGVNSFNPQEIADKPNITGIVEYTDIKGTLDLAINLDSKIEKIIIFNDKTSTGRICLEEINTFIDDYKNKYTIDIISDYTTEEIKEYLKSVQEHSIILLVAYNRDHYNNFIQNGELMNAIQSSCHFCTYSSWDYYLNYGIVGGVIGSSKEYGIYASVFADRILHGVSPRSIPVLNKNLTKVIFDYKEIIKNKISLSNLNEKYKIINSPYEYIVEYRPYLIYIFIIILILFVIIMLLSVNIIKRKYIEIQLNESKTNFESLILSMNEGFFVQSENEIIEFVNDKFCSMLQLSKDDILGSHITNFVAQEDLENFFSAVNSQQNIDSEINIEVNLVSHSKGLISTIVSPKKRYGTNGEFKGVFCVVTDITELKNVQRRLSYEKERLYTTLDSIGDGVITTDMNGTILFCNKVAEEISQWDNGLMLNRSINEVYIRYDSKTNKPVDGISDIADDKNMFSDLMLQTKSGELVNIEETIAPIVDENNISIGYVIVFRDIADRKLIEEEIIKSQKIESIGLLAGSLAHDFNNILSGIMGNLYMAKTYIRMNNLNNEELTELITDMEEASERAKKLTAQMLTFAKGGTPICKEFDLKSLLVQSSEFAIVGNDAIKLEFNISPNLWLINADEGQIDQVLNNLIINASQAMPNGGKITVEARNCEIDNDSSLPLKSGNYVQVKVIDTGTGITPENLKKIFDPYFTTKVKGYGIGLASTFSIIKKHSGYITCQSTVDVGTTFIFYLPASSIQPVESGKSEPDNEKNDKAKNSKIKLLMMDDNEDVLHTNTRLLEYFGFTVDAAIDGEQAVSLYKKSMEQGSVYNVCILDLVIPGKKNGDVVLAELKNLNPDIKSILTSGYSVDPVVADYEKYGFSAVLSKPYQIESLIQIINKLAKS